MAKQGVDRRDFVITHDRAAYGSRALYDFALRTKTPNAFKGIGIGIGRGSKPISNFPGRQTLVAPFQCFDDWEPRISIPDLISSLSGIRGRLQRVTAKIGRGTDPHVVREIFNPGFKELLAGIEDPAVEMVLSSSDPRKLKEYQDLGIEADVWQQDLTLDLSSRQSVSKDAVVRALGGDIVPKAEIAFPVLPDGFRSVGQMVSIMNLLGGKVDRGQGIEDRTMHDAYLTRLLTPNDVFRALQVLIDANHDKERGRSMLRGFTVSSLDALVNCNTSHGISGAALATVVPPA